MRWQGSCFYSVWLLARIVFEGKGKGKGVGVREDVGKR